MFLMAIMLITVFQQTADQVTTMSMRKQFHDQVESRLYLDALEKVFEDTAAQWLETGDALSGEWLNQISARLSSGNQGFRAIDLDFIGIYNPFDAASDPVTNPVGSWTNTVKPITITGAYNGYMPLQSLWDSAFGGAWDYHRPKLRGAFLSLLDGLTTYTVVRIYRFKRSNVGMGTDIDTDVYVNFANVPATQFNFVGYTIPTRASEIKDVDFTPSSQFFNNGGRLLIPVADQGFSAGGYSLLPRLTRLKMAIGWSLYQYIFSDFINEVEDRAVAHSNAAYFHTDTTSVSVAGVSISGKTVTVNVASLPEEFVYIKTSDSSFNINVTGTTNTAYRTPSVAVPVVVIDAIDGVTPTITFSGNNVRPVLFVLNQGRAVYNNVMWEGGMMLGPDVNASGTLSMIGHFSFPTTNPPFSTLNFSIMPDATIVRHLSERSPYQELVSACAYDL